MDENKDMNDDGVPDNIQTRNDQVSRLMNLAGPRPPIPVDVERRVYGKVEKEWVESLPRYQPKRWAVPLALAASIIITVAVNMRSADVPMQTLGTIARVTGLAAESVGQAVHVGDTLRTAPGQGISVAVLGGLSLRIAGDTSLRFDDSDDFTLLSGRVYADSGQQVYRDRHITIHAATGSVTDIGTQFSVLFEDGELAVAVREGKVDIAAGEKTQTAVAGEKVLLKAGREVVTEQIDPNDDSWDWAVALAPGFDIENKSLLDFLKWAARETGKELVFTSDELRMSAMKAKLRGSVSDFTPDEATESVLSTTSFDYRIDEYRITIGQ